MRGRTLPCSYGQLILEPCLEIWWCATRVQAMCPLGKCSRPPFLSLPIACLSFEFFLNVTEIWPFWNTTLVSGLFLITVTCRIDLGLLQMDIFFGVNSSRVLNFMCLFICLSTIVYGVSLSRKVLGMRQRTSWILPSGSLTGSLGGSWGLWVHISQV